MVLAGFNEVTKFIETRIKPSAVVCYVSESKHFVILSSEVYVIVIGSQSMTP